MTYCDDYDHITEFAEPAATRVLRECAKQQSIGLEVLDKRHGYLVRLTQGRRQVILQSRFLTTNTAIAINLARDKVHTYLVLKKAGIDVPSGDYFFVKDYFQRNSYAAGKDLEGAMLYAKSLASRVGYPLIVKPGHLKQGRGVTKVFREADIARAISRALNASGQKEFMIIVQEYICGPEYRVVLVRGKITACYRKMVSRLIGDGTHTICDLLDTTSLHFNEINLQALECSGLTPKSVLREKEEIILDDITNIGTEPINVEVIHPAIVRICQQSCSALGLYYAGIDLRCNDISQAERGVIIEVNGNPWLVDYFYSSAEARSSVELTYGMLLRDLLDASPESEMLR